MKLSLRTISLCTAVMTAAMFPISASADDGTLHGGSSVIGSSYSLVIHPVPQGIYYAMHNDDFTVRVRVPGGQWHDLYEYKVKVNMDAPSEASMVFFPQNISVEFDGDKHHNLHIFANPLEKDVPNPDDDGVIYFEPGVHTPAEGEDGFRIPSDSRVYLAPGSVVKGTIICDSVKNVTIGGRGLLVTPQRGIQATYSENIRVEDIIVVNPRHYTFLGGQSRNINIRNLRSFSYQGWSDGIDVMSSSDITVDNVFMRNSDDCIAIYGPRWEYRGDTRNITVRNSVLWADIAHPMNMGIHGYTGDGKGSVIENITFRNIDVLEHDEDDPEYQGCMAICCGDMNHIRNILYEDIRVERIEEGQLFHVEVVFNSKYCSAPGNSVSGVTFRNITCPAIMDMNPSSLKGYDRNRMVSDVVFENVRIGEWKMKTTDSFITNEFIKNITVK